MNHGPNQPPKQKLCQFELKEMTVGLLRSHRTGPWCYSAVKVCYSSRQGKNNPEGDLEVIRAACLLDSIRFLSCIMFPLCNILSCENEKDKIQSLQ